MVTKFFNFVFFLVILIASQSNFAQDLVYNPINPSFVGGNSFNAQWLQSQASLQNKLTEDNAFSGFETDPLQEFQEGLQRQLLSEISRRLVLSTFGEEGLSEGVYELGNFRVEINPAPNGLNIIIFDNLSGNQTQIFVPFL